MILTKECLVCGKTFEKPYYRSLKNWDNSKFCSTSCKKKSQIGKSSPLKGRKSELPSTMQYLPCRICGESTSYPGTSRNKLYDMVHCKKPECVDASRKLKNDNISAKAIEMYASGERIAPKTTWQNVKGISPEEELLSPWLESLGFCTQHKLLTGVHTNKLPRAFWLDFALPEHKLYIEVDGSIHRLRKERDARHDSMMTGLGWIGLRIKAESVRSDIDSVKQQILAWLQEYATT